MTVSLSVSLLQLLENEGRLFVCLASRRTGPHYGFTGSARDTEAALGGGDEHARSALTIPRAVHPRALSFFSFFFFLSLSFLLFHFTFFPRVSLSYRLGSVPGERTGKKFKYPKISKYPWWGGGGLGGGLPGTSRPSHLRPSSRAEGGDSSTRARRSSLPEPRSRAPEPRGFTPRLGEEVSPA